MVLVLVSRKVKGIPVGVEPTLSTGCADAGMAARTSAAVAARTRRLKSIVPPSTVWQRAMVLRFQLLPSRPVIDVKLWAHRRGLRKEGGGFGRARAPHTTVVPGLSRGPYPAADVVGTEDNNQR